MKEELLIFTAKNAENAKGGGFLCFTRQYFGLAHYCEGFRDGLFPICVYLRPSAVSFHFPFFAYFAYFAVNPSFSAFFAVE
jgi:hypothetical protein